MADASSVPPSPNSPGPVEIENPQRSQRFIFLDGLRGIASLMVVITHLYSASILHPQLARICPNFIDHFIGTWFLGVPIFFVLSGFVIAYSQRNIRITLRFLGNFAVRRSLRLDPPYWLAIALTIISTHFMQPYMAHPYPMPGLRTTLCNMFYMQGILNSQMIVAPSWTLCFEVQFYLTLTILVGVAQALPYSKAPLLGWRIGWFIPIFVPLAIASLWVQLHGYELAYVPGYWWMFFLGAMIWWNLNGLVNAGWLLGYMVAIAGVLCFDHNGYTAAGLMTGMAIFIAGQTGGLLTWLRWRWIQFFGAISYSLYLTHDLFGPLEFLGKRIFHDSTLGAWVTVVVIFAVCVGFAYVMYRFVERTGVALGNRLKSRRRELFLPQSPPAVADRTVTAPQAS